MRSLVPATEIPVEDGLEVLLPVLVVTAAHSRFILGRTLPPRRTKDLLAATWALLQELGWVSRPLIWDNEPGIGRGKRHADGVAAFVGPVEVYKRETCTGRGLLGDPVRA